MRGSRAAPAGPTRPKPRGPAVRRREGLEPQVARSAAARTTSLGVLRGSSGRPRSECTAKVTMETTTAMSSYLHQ